MKSRTFNCRLWRWTGLAFSTASTARAQPYPSKPIRWVVPSSPGGSADAVTRLVANGLPAVLGQRVIVDNRAGASGNIGADAVAKSPPDGYTWLMINNAHAANVSLYSKLPYDLLHDFAFVTQVDSSPHAVVVHPSLPVKSISDLVKLAKARPGALDYASAGTGTVTFLAAELFVDLLVEFKHDALASLFDMVRMQDELSQMFGRKVDLATATVLENPYRRRAILKDLRELYAA